MSTRNTRLVPPAFVSAALALLVLLGPSGADGAAKKAVAAPPPAATQNVAPPAAAPPAEPAAEAAPAPAPVPVAAADPPKREGANPNTFNRLLKKRGGKVNAPPTEDGIHDPANPGTASLQPPLEAFGDLPKSNGGNHVDWVKAIDGKLVFPRFDRDDAEAEANVFELDIVREVKGSMPDVVYPHKQHTQWLDCTNCHDEIFIPEKGKNQISMAAILLGQKCGVCHGKVAFPVSDCRRCHSKPKTPEQLKGLAKN